MKVVKFQYKNGFISNVNEAAADILEKRGDGKILISKKSVIADKSKIKASK